MNETPTTEPAETVGEIVSLLVKERVISQDQLRYALRVHAKIQSTKTLIDVLQDLEYLSRDDVARSLRKNTPSIRIGDVLVELGYLLKSDLLAALSLQKEGTEHKMLGDIFIENGFIEERKLVEVLSFQLGFPVAELEFRKLDRKLFSRAPVQVFRDALFVPIATEQGVVSVAFANPLERRSREAAETVFGLSLQPAIASRKSILAAIAAMENSAGN